MIMLILIIGLFLSKPAYLHYDNSKIFFWIGTKINQNYFFEPPINKKFECYESQIYYKFIGVTACSVTVYYHGMFPPVPKNIVVMHGNN